MTEKKDQSDKHYRNSMVKSTIIIEGIKTTIPLHKKLLNHKKFIDSDFNVSWLDNEKII